jgi:hypothetical protein
MSGPKMAFSLTRKQAKVLWSLIDGAADAGSCSGGLTKAELAACHAFLNQYYAQLLPSKGEDR